MSGKNKQVYLSVNNILSLAFSISLLGCSSEATKKSTANRFIADSLSINTQLVNSEESTTKQECDLVKIYSQAIGDYLQMIKTAYNLSADTLFFGKHVYGQPDDFPDIVLPAVIEKTIIKLISPEQGAKKQMENKSSFYINLIGSVESDQAEFIFVAFSNGMTHQFDCHINYIYNIAKQEFEIKNSRFENFLYKTK